MQSEISLRDAKARLSEVLDRVAAGESIEIVRKGAKPGRFRIIATKSGSVVRRPGALKGRFKVPDDFDAADPEIISLFEGT